MKNKKGYLSIAFLSLVLGVILSIQFKTVEKSVGTGSLPTQRAQQLAMELKKAQADVDAQTKRIKELEEKINQYEKGNLSKDEQTESLYRDIMRYRMLAGLLDLEGPGIVVEINEPVYSSQIGDYFSLVNQLDLVLQVISVLNAVDAEAISINGQRYTAYTEIVNAANHIEINGISTNSPLVIKAIGDPEYLEGALTFKGGIVDQLRNFDYIVKINQESKITIPKYNKIKDFIYSKPADEKLD